MKSFLVFFIIKITRKFSEAALEFVGGFYIVTFSVNNKFKRINLSLLLDSTNEKVSE